MGEGGFFSQMPRNATVQAVGECKLWNLTYLRFVDMSQKLPRVALALSLAFTSGQMSAQSFTRYARRIELDMETIALNRTQVGFSHGNDTFGWRFYPRVQSPPTDSNATVLFRDMLLGGPCRNAELKTMRLEPGQR